MGHYAHCKKCKSAFLKTLEEEFGGVKNPWKSGWPCRIEDILHHSTIKKKTAQALEKIYVALQGHRGYHAFVGKSKLPPCDYYIPALNCLVELDEPQHFTAPRALTLSLYPAGVRVGYRREMWYEKCVTLDRHDNDPVHRDETRAWYDTLRDILPASFGLNPTIRLLSNEKIWCEEDSGIVLSMLRDRISY